MICRMRSRRMGLVTIASRVAPASVSTWSRMPNGARRTMRRGKPSMASRSLDRMSYVASSASTNATWKGRPLRIAVAEAHSEARNLRLLVGCVRGTRRRLLFGVVETQPHLLVHSLEVLDVVFECLVVVVRVGAVLRDGGRAPSDRDDADQRQQRSVGRSTWTHPPQIGTTRREPKRGGGSSPGVQPTRRLFHWKVALP